MPYKTCCMKMNGLAEGSWANSKSSVRITGHPEMCFSVQSLMAYSRL